eukprot:1160862-Pelagomonas_calceolata.AAC.5
MKLSQSPQYTPQGGGGRHWTCWTAGVGWPDPVAPHLHTPSTTYNSASVSMQQVAHGNRDS